MMISEITRSDVIDALRIEAEYCNTVHLQGIMTAAKEYIKSYTGLTDTDIDTHAEFYTAYMVLCQDMYDNRSMYVEKSNVNKVVETILGMHCVNLL